MQPVFSMALKCSVGKQAHSGKPRSKKGEGGKSDCGLAQLGAGERRPQKQLPVCSVSSLLF